MLHACADRGLERVLLGDAEYGELDVLQAQEMDPDKRAEYIHRMQQVMYQDCPCIDTVHPYKLQAYRTSTWDGWKLTGNGGKDGPEFAFLSASMPWAYYDLTPKAVEEETSNLGLWVAIILAIVVVAAIVILLIVRARRGGPAEEVSGPLARTGLKERTAPAAAGPSAPFPR